MTTDISSGHSVSSIVSARGLRLNLSLGLTLPLRPRFIIHSDRDYDGTAGPFGLHSQYLVIAEYLIAPNNRR